MRMAAQIPLFAALALGLHIAGFAIWTGSKGGSQSSGSGGDNLISIEAAAPQLASLVQSWEMPPDVTGSVTAPRADPVDGLAAPETPLAETRPQILPYPAAPVPARADQPPEPLPLPAQVAPDSTAPALPQPASDEVAPAPRADPEPAPIRQAQKAPEAPEPANPPTPQAPPPPPDAGPARPAEQSRPASAAAEAQRAAGSGGRAQAGERDTAQTATLSASERRSLMVDFGGQIRARVEHFKQFPAAAKRNGRVVLNVRVNRDGALQGVAIQRSSGDAALDAAALDAVRSAAPFPPAPKTLPGPTFLFALPISFRR